MDKKFRGLNSFCGIALGRFGNLWLSIISTQYVLELYPFRLVSTEQINNVVACVLAFRRYCGKNTTNVSLKVPWDLEFRGTTQ